MPPRASSNKRIFGSGSVARRSFSYVPSFRTPKQPPTRTTDETPEPTAADLSPEFAALAAAGVALQAHAAAGPADEEARLAAEKDVAEAAAVLEQLEADEAAMLGGS